MKAEIAEWNLARKTRRRLELNEKERELAKLLEERKDKRKGLLRSPEKT
jgi:hypothetical protein